MEINEVAKAGIDIAKPESPPPLKTDYAAFLRVKVSKIRTTGSDGIETTTTRESTVLSDQGKEMAKKVFHKISEGGFDVTQTWLDKIRKDIETDRRLPVGQKNLSPEQKIYYGKLLRSCEMQLRNNQMVGIKEEIATSGNIWANVVKQRAQKTNQSEKFVKNSVAAQINKHRAVLISSIKLEVNAKPERINQAVRWAEQTLLLAMPGIDDPLQVLENPQIKSKALEFLKPVPKKITIQETTGILDSLKSKAIEVKKGWNLRTRLGIKFCQAALATVLFLGAVTTGSQILESGKAAFGKSGQEVTQNISKVVEYADDYFGNLTTVQEQQYAQHHNIEESQLPEETPIPEATVQPPTITPVPTLQLPSLEQQWRDKEKELLIMIDLQDCMTIQDLKSPEYGDVFPVVVYNAAKNTTADNVCQEQYPKLSKLKPRERKTLQGSTLRTVVIDPEFQNKNPDFVFAKGMEERFVGWREIDGTCFLTAISTIAANIAERNNQIPLSPYALSAILEFITDKRSEVLEPDTSKRVDIASRSNFPREIPDYGILNRGPDDLINDQILAALGLQYRTVPVNNYVTRDAAGTLLNRSNEDTTTHDPMLWRDKGNILAWQFLGIISRGEYPIYVSEVEPGIGHATTIIGVEIGDENKDSFILVYEPANGGLDYFWSLTGGEDGWENVKDGSGRSTGIMRIPLNEKNLRTFNQFPALKGSEADNYIPVLGEKEEAKFLSFMQITKN